MLETFVLIFKKEIHRFDSGIAGKKCYFFVIIFAQFL